MKADEQLTKQEEIVFNMISSDNEVKLYILFTYALDGYQKEYIHLYIIQLKNIKLSHVIA